MNREDMATGIYFLALILVFGFILATTKVLADRDAVKQQRRIGEALERIAISLEYRR